jgi:A/G-specific adenine glycosylase
MIDDFSLEQLAAPLQTWFLGHARVLPWREDPQPYYVWISEIMLQQTRVEAVKPYFERFITELPDVRSLAECDEERLLKLWEGLGYYNRARNLKAAAQQIMEDYGGVIPSEYEELLKLKGIGHYTAGAIASIAYGKPVPAVDGNVLRVISRVTGDDSDIMKQSVRTHMEEKLKELMTAGTEAKGAAEAAADAPEAEVAVDAQASDVCVQPRIFNQALMELGAIVCVPNGAPHCEECPWCALCRARKEGLVDVLPVKKKAKERRIEERTVFIIRDGDRVAIRKRPQKGLLAGLYELPNCEGYPDYDGIVAYVKSMGFLPLRIQPLADAKHIFSHVEWHMKGYAVLVEEMEDAPAPGSEAPGQQAKQPNAPEREAPGQRTKQPNAPGSEVPGSGAQTPWIFVEAADARERYAIPAAFAKYAAYMNIKIGME